jgi:RimJ/RimL family protein N-acetyltransferase
MNLSPVVLEGRFVRLEPLAEEHRSGLRAAADDPRIWQFTVADCRGAGFDPAFDEALTLAAAGTRLPFAIRLTHTGELVGSTSYLDPVPRHKRVEIGATWYHPRVWATAVNPECKLLLLTHAFEGMGVNRVSFMVDSLNERSQAAVGKLGAVREGVLRAHMVVQGGRIRDTVVFGVTAAEWPAVRERLTARLQAFS